MAQCFESELGTLEVSDDAYAPADPNGLLATYNGPVPGLTSMNANRGLEQDISNLLDSTDARLICSINCTLAIPVAGVMCYGDADFDSLEEAGDQCINKYVRYRPRGAGSGLPEYLGFVSVDSWSVAHTPRQTQKYTATLTFQTYARQVQP